MEAVTDHGHTAPVEQPSVMRRHPVKHEIKGRPVRLAVPARQNAGGLRGTRRPVSGLGREAALDRRADIGIRHQQFAPAAANRLLQPVLMIFRPACRPQKGKRRRPVEQAVAIGRKGQLSPDAERARGGAQRRHHAAVRERRQCRLKRIAAGDHLRTRQIQSPIPVFLPAGIGALTGAVCQHHHRDPARLGLVKKIENAVDQAAADIDHPEPVENQRIDMRQDVGKPAGPARTARHRPCRRHLAAKRLIDPDDVIKGDGVRRWHAQAGWYGHANLECLSGTDGNQN